MIKLISCVIRSFSTGTINLQGMQTDNSNVTWRVYYPGGGLRVQTASTQNLSFLVQDHINSTSMTLNNSGAVTGEIVYSAFGETRATYGSTPTTKLYTGQYEAEAGLYFYNARWFDSELGRFVQADKYVPVNQGVQAWDRYADVTNNPVKYNDPSGHRVECGIYSGTSCGGDGPITPKPVWDQNGITASVIYNMPNEIIVNGGNYAWKITTTIYSVISEPVDWLVTGSQCLQGDCSAWVLLGLLPVIPSSSWKYTDDIIQHSNEFGTGLIRIVRKDQIGTSQTFKLRKGEDGLLVFEGVSPYEVLEAFPGNVVSNSTVTILKNTLPLGTQIESILDPNLSQRLSEAHRILIRPEGSSAERFAKALKALVGW